jgi:RsiW-degrading membrane proteinase PrsW (M82 family)
MGARVGLESVGRERFCTAGNQTQIVHPVAHRLLATLYHSLYVCSYVCIQDRLESTGEPSNTLLWYDFWGVFTSFLIQISFCRSSFVPLIGSNLDVL